MDSMRSTSAPSTSPTVAGDGLDLGRIEIEPGPLPRSGVDANGRALPIADEAWAARMKELDQKLAEIDAADDEPADAAYEFMRNIDAERRREGRPPAYEGCY